jgi:hypothetical protein
LQAVVAELERQGAARRAAAATLVARLLVHAAALRLPVPREALASPGGRERALEQFRDQLAGVTQKCVQAVLGVYGFRSGEADVALQPWTSGRWQVDLFHPQTLQDAGRKLGTGAVVGAAVGAVADVALAGLSLGAATALGAAVGGVASQGWSQVPRKLMHRLQGAEELSVEDTVLLALADSLVRLISALERRGHAATAQLHIPAAVAGPGTLQALVQALSAARGFASDGSAPPLAASPDARREALSGRVAALLLRSLSEA